MKKEIENTIIVKTPLDDLISERYGDYAKYIIQDRALPDARDGLKPVQRRILYAMYRDGNTSDKGFRKSAKTVGLVIGNYHPHGDSSVYEAMVRLSQSWKINYPLVEMHGNNGSIDDDPAAAMRYTEARLAPIAETLLQDIDKKTVTWTPNFDDTENEPTVLPAKFPNLLVNGCTGIAAGYATNIPPHNLKEVIEATIYRLNNPNCTIEELTGFIAGPDFPTGGIIQGIDGIKEAFNTGKGRIIVRSKATIEKTKTIQQIIVSEIPYEVIKTNIVKKIDDIRFNKSIDGITDVRDESDRNGLRIVVDIKKDADSQLILNYLYKNTDLQVSYNYNMIAIVNNRPTLLSIDKALDCYMEYMKQCILKRSKFEFEKRLDRCHILEGLIKAVSVMDEIIHIIRQSKDKADAKNQLIARFEFSEAQAEAIVILRLYRLTNTDVFELKEEYKTLVDELKALKEIIDSKQRLAAVMSEELNSIKDKYGHDRLTQIEDKIEDIQIDKKSMIINERVIVTLSRDGYIKRVSLRSYNANDNQLTTLKDTDNLIGIKEADTYDVLLAFSASGEYVCLPVYQIEECKWKDIGQHISKYVKVNNSEKFVSACIVKNFNSYCWIITASALGMIKKTALQGWELQRNSRSSLAMNLIEGDSVIAGAVCYRDDEVYLVTANGYGNRYSERSIPDVSARAKGVKAVKLIGDDTVKSMAIVSNEHTEMVYLTTTGQSKRIKLTDIPVTNRATKGVIVAKKNKTNPAVLQYCLSGNLNDDLNIVENNSISNVKFKDINLMDADSRFSLTGFSKDYYHFPGINEVKVIDFVDEESTKDYEEITLEV